MSAQNPARKAVACARPGRVSIVINNYNYGRFLGQAIESVLAQDPPPAELVVVDDGSGDESRAVIASYGNRIVPVLKENGGQATALNAGLRRCTGDLVVFLDADDLLLAGAIAALQPLAATPGLAKIHWPMVIVDEDGLPTGKLMPPGRLVRGAFRDALIRSGPDHHVIPPNSPPTSGNAWPRPLLDRICPMPEAGFRTGADNYLLNLAPLFGEIVALDQPLGGYRVHGANDSLRPLAPYAREFVSRHELCRAAMRDLLLRDGVDVPEDAWPRDTWFHQIVAATEEFEAIVPVGARVLFAATWDWQRGPFFTGRERVSFPADTEEYYGDPPDDDFAIENLRREQGLGVTHIAFDWSKFWYWDHYPRFTAQIERSHRRLLSSRFWRIFELGAGN